MGYKTSESRGFQSQNGHALRKMDNRGVQGIHDRGGPVCPTPRRRNRRRVIAHLFPDVSIKSWRDAHIGASRPDFVCLSALVGHNSLGDAYAVHSGGDYPARVARALAAGVETADIGLEDIVP